VCVCVCVCVYVCMCACVHVCACVLVHRPDGRDLDVVSLGEAVTSWALCLVASR